MDSYRVPAERGDDAPDKTEPRAGEPSMAWITRVLGAIFLFAGIGLGVSLCAATESPAKWRWTFVDDAADPKALGFRAGPPRTGTWALEANEAATGARALVNRAGDDDAPPARLLAGSPLARDLKASTRCKTDGTQPSGACGLVFRFADDDNHHVARLDIDGRRAVLSVVSSGEERELGSGRCDRIESGVWQELSVLARGGEIRVACNARDVIVVTDPIPAYFGSVGLWAPASVEAHFDELVVEPLPASPQALEVLPLLRGGAT